MEPPLSSSTESKSAVVFSTDGINTMMLPPYGNTVIDTPNLNTLASQSLLFDFAFSETPDSELVLESIWHATHPLSKAHEHSSEHLSSKIAEFGIHSTLVTDDPRVAESDGANRFDRVVLLESDPVEGLADSESDSWMASFFAQALQLIEQQDGDSLLWIHSRTLSGPWDAPYEYRASLADPEDPEPPRSSQPPVGDFNEDDDSPDLLLGFQQSCAGQILLFDQFLGVIVDAIESSTSTLFAFLSTRGYPLGEHGRIGEPMNLHGESTHVPLMVRWPNGSHAARAPSLVQLTTLNPILFDWFETEAANGTNQPLEFTTYGQKAVVSITTDSIAIQTPAWKLIRQRKEQSKVAHQLFKKPDDRWEVNDVYDRCPQIVPAMEELLDKAIFELESEGRLTTPIPDELMN